MPGRLDGQPGDILLEDIGREDVSCQECLGLLGGQYDLARSPSAPPEESIGA